MKTSAFAKTRGLVTNSSPVLTPGDLVQAWNVLVRRGGWIEQRRGYRQLNSVGTTGLFANDNIYGAFQYNTNLYLQTRTGALRQVSSISGSTVVASLGFALPFVAGAATDPSKTYSRTAIMNGNLYVAGSTGVWSYATSKPRVAGIQAAPDMLTVTGMASGSGFMANNTGVGYRIVWGVQDESLNVIQGPPSGRATVFNTTGSPQNTQLQIQVPVSVMSDIALNSRVYNYYIYRTEVSAAAASLAAIPDPGDEMNLIYQGQISTAQTNNAFTFIDSTPDGFTKGPDLYTNSGQGGLAVASYMPPACADVASYRGVNYYASATTFTTGQETLIGIPDNWTITNCVVSGGNSVTLTFSGAPDLTLEGFTNGTSQIAVTGNSGANINGDWTITGSAATTITYSTGGGSVTGTGGTAMVASLGVNGGVQAYASYATESTFTAGSTVYFKVTSAGSTAQNLALTIQSLVRALNKNSTFYGGAVTLVARAGDAAADAPGVVRFESAYASTQSGTSGGGVSYPTLTTARLFVAKGSTFATTKWYPSLATAMIMSTPSNYGRMYYSKTNEPESVPLTSYFDVGDKAARIRRVVNNRDSLFIFKDDGLFRLSGDPNHGAQPTRFDDNIFLLGDNMVTLMNNKIYAVTTRGVCEITDNGARWISGNIQDQIRLLMDWASTGATSVFAQHCVANERDACVFFYMQFGSTVTDRSSKVFSMCYNSETETWTATDATGPHQWPGFYAKQGNTSIQGSTIYRHHVATSGSARELLMENTAFPADDPLLGTVTAGMPLPGDGYYFRVTATGAGTATLASRSLWTTTVSPGDILFQLVGGTYFAWTIVTGGTGASVACTLTALGGAATGPSLNGGLNSDGDATLFKPFTSTVTWADFSSEDASLLKHWAAVNVLLDRRSTADSTTISTATELVPTASQQVVSTRQLSQRLFVPATMQRSRKLAVTLDHAQAGKYLFIEGIAYDYTPHQANRENE